MSINGLRGSSGAVLFCLCISGFVCCLCFVIICSSSFHLSVPWEGCHTCDTSRIMREFPAFEAHLPVSHPGNRISGKCNFPILNSVHFASNGTLAQFYSYHN